MSDKDSERAEPRIIWCHYCGEPITEGLRVDRPDAPGDLHEKCLIPYGETFLHWTKSTTS